jgi:DNA polymerase III subunit delta
LAEFTWQEVDKPPLDDKAYLQSCRAWLLVGEEEWLRHKFQKHLLENLLAPDEREWGLVVLQLSPALVRSQPPEGTWAKHILVNGTTLPFFCARRVMVVEEAQLLPADQQQEIAAALDQVSDQSVFIFVSSESVTSPGAKTNRNAEPKTGKGKTRTPKAISVKLRNAIKKTGNIVTFAALDDETAIGWATRYVKRCGKRLDQSAASLLVNQRIGTDIGQLKRELDKLLVFMGDVNTITTAHVGEMAPKLLEDHIFDLTRALAQGRMGLSRALIILRRLLASGEEPERLLPPLSKQIRLLWQAKGILENGWRPGDALRDAGFARTVLQEPTKESVAAASPKYLPILIDQAKRFSWPQLQRALKALAECDLAMKGLSRPPRGKELALELAITTICS